MEITGKTTLTGLIGSPVKHSISPQMHNEAFRQLNLDYAYLAFDLADSDLETAVRGLQALGAKGFNVTMPYKVQIIKYMDELTPASQIAQACNTVISKDGKLIGHTTDGVGFMESVADAGHNIIGKKMTVLGAGGAATAICTQAALDGVSDIDIFQMKSFTEEYERALAFADRVRLHTDCNINVYDFADTDQMRKSISESAILTNATNVGMAPHEDQCPIPDASMLFPELIVCDIIYNPMKTKLYQMAESAGCQVFNGTYMLLFQGAASFECWTGKKMPVEIIRKKYFQK